MKGPVVLWCPAIVRRAGGGQLRDHTVHIADFAEHVTDAWVASWVMRALLLFLADWEVLSKLLRVADS